MMLAHVAGIPVEELAVLVVSTGGSLLVAVRALRHRARRDGPPARIRAS